MLVMDFPRDVLAGYGARQLAKKLEPERNAFRAVEIPDLLSDALLLKSLLRSAQCTTISGLSRNDVAHGSTPPLSVHTLIKKTTALRSWAARIDAHIGKHFLVLAKYAR